MARVRQARNLSLALLLVGGCDAGAAGRGAQADGDSAEASHECDTDDACSSGSTGEGTGAEPAPQDASTGADDPAATESGNATTGGPDPAGDETTDSGGSSTGAAGNDSDTDEQWVPLVNPDGVVGNGIHYKEIANASGPHIFVGYGGYSVQQGWSDAWVDALFEARLAELGVRHLVSVQGPNDPGYDNLEIGNTKLAATLVDWVQDDAETDASTEIIIAAHSSGTFVAHELFAQLVGSWDPDGATADRITYFNLDGARSGLNAAIVAHWRRAYFVYALKSSGGSQYLSQNANSMLLADGVFGDAMAISADNSGCVNTAGWCLHDTVINTRPHNPNTFDLALDYTDFEDDGQGRAVAVEYLDNVEWD